MAIKQRSQPLDRIGWTSGNARFFGTQDGGTSWQETPLPEGLQDIYTLACG
jgi:hypothetical protein